MRRSDYLRLLCVLAACLVLCGCGAGDPLGRRAIRGNVTLDGVALDSGTIHFEPQGPSAVHGSGTVILNGAYEMSAEHGLPAGSYKVSISAPEAMEQTAVMGQELPPPAERVPAEYNVATRLVAEVTDSGPNRFDYNLQSAGNPPE